MSSESPVGKRRVDRPAQLLQLFEEKIRPLLEAEQHVRVDGLVRHADVLRASLARPERLQVGFLGESQVGKSSLINAVVGQTVLPSGGLGPLTAQATTVTRDGDSGVLTARYHTRVELNQLLFGLRRLETAGPTNVEVAPGDDTEEDGDTDPSAPAAVSRRQYMLGQAELLLTDGHSGSTPIPQILDGLRLSLGHSVVRDVPEAIRGRAASIQRLLGTTETIREADGSRREFNAALRLRAAGWMSPLVAELKVSLDSEVTRALDLIDLPGLGVVADPAGLVAQEFVVSKNGDALVIVMRNNGMTEAVADTLEKTGVMTRLLFAGEDNSRPIRILLAVTHLDDVARSRYQEAAAAAREAGEKPPDRSALFSELASQMEAKIRSQLQSALKNSESVNSLTADHRQRRIEVIDTLCRQVGIACVAAPDFLSLELDDAENAFVKVREATNIPRFRELLLSVSEEVQARRDMAIADASSALASGIQDHLSAIQQTYADGEGRAVRKWDEFTSTLRNTLHELRPDMTALHGETLSRLKEVIPRDIDLLCSAANESAQTRLRNLRRKGENLYYQSLVAALTRGGKWDAREIDYPTALTNGFIDHIATDWEKVVVKAVRKAVEDLADRDVALVQQLCSSASAHDDRIVVDAQIESQQRILTQEARSCVVWTRERLDELRAKVHASLVDAVTKVIEEACRNAIRAGRHRGDGAKGRILDVFSESGERAIASARDAAIKILRQQYQKIFKELEEGYLAVHHDPLTAAFEALTDQELTRARRSDRQRSKRVLEQTESLLAQVNELALVRS